VKLDFNIMYILKVSEYEDQRELIWRRSDLRMSLELHGELALPVGHLQRGELPEDFDLDRFLPEDFDFFLPEDFDCFLPEDFDLDRFLRGDLDLFLPEDFDFFLPEDFDLDRFLCGD